MTYNYLFITNDVAPTSVPRKPKAVLRHRDDVV